MLASVVHFPNPFALSDRELVAVEQPITVRDYLDERGVDEFDRPTVALYNGEGLMRSQWATTHLANDDVLCFVALPQGGGDGGTDPLRMILMIGLLIATQGMIGGELLFGELTAAQVAAGVGYSTGQMMVVHAAQVAVMMGGSMLINALLPIQPPDSPNLPSPTYTITARNNRPRPREAIPVLYGRHLIVPDFCETPYVEYSGQTEQASSSSSGVTAQQTLYQVLCLGQGEIEVDTDGVRLGDTNVTGFDEVEWEVYAPGAQVTLVPESVTTSGEVNNVALPGVGDKDEAGSEFYSLTDIQPGQIEPEHWAQFKTATGGGSHTATADDALANPRLSEGVTYGVLDQTGAGWTQNEWLGNVVFIGGHTGSDNSTGRLGYAGWDKVSEADQYDNAGSAHPSDQLVHPDRTRAVYANDAERIYVRPVWHASYAPGTTNNQYHLRDDWQGPFAANHPETTINLIAIDITGLPLMRSDKSERLALGMRFEHRRIDDNGDPLTDSTGEWSILGTERADLHNNGLLPQQVWSSGNPTGTRSGHRATIGLYGTGYKLNPIAISFEYPVAEGRYEVRGRRTTVKNKSEYSNEVKWGGLRAHLTSADRKFDGVTVLAIKILASGQLNSSNFQKVSVIATRKLPIYQGDAFSTSLSSTPAATTVGTSGVNITHAGHGLPTGAQVVLSGFSGDVGGVPLAELNATHTITRVDDNTYSVIVATNASSTATGGSSITATGAGGFTATQATTSPAWAIADALRSSVYSVGLADSKVDLDGLITLANTWQDHGDEFNAVFDRQMGVTEAVSLIARAGRARLFLPEGKATIVRDQAQPLRTAMYSNRNMTRGSLAIQYRFDSSETPDSVEVEYMDSGTWKPRSVHAYLYDGGEYAVGTARRQPSGNANNRKINGTGAGWAGATAGDAIIGARFAFTGANAGEVHTITAVNNNNTIVVDPPVSTDVSNSSYQTYTIFKAGSRDKPARMKLFGVTSREQAWREGMYSVSDSRYRRRSISFETDFEGHIAAVGDLVAVTHDVLSLDRQSGDTTGWDAGTKYLTTSEPLVWEGGDNIVTNGGFETDTTGWGAGGTNNTIDRVTTDDGVVPQTGDACLQSTKSAYDSGSTYLAVYYNLTSVTGTAQDTVMSARAWVKAGNANAVGEKVQFTLRETGGLTAYEESDGLDWTLTDEWQEVATTYRIQQSDRTLTHLYFVMSAGTGQTFPLVLLMDNVEVWTGPFVVTLKGDQGQPVGPTTCYPIIDYTQPSPPKRNGTVRANEMELLSAPGFTPTTELGTRERTQFAFGTTSAWTTDCRVTAIIPRGENRVQLRVVNEDSRVHTADDETYVGTLDVQGLAGTPDAPTVTGVTAHLRGDAGSRQVSASWHAAPGAIGYEVEHSDTLTGRWVAVSGLVITDGPIEDGETLRAYSTPVEFLSMNIIAGQSVAFITVPIGSPHGLTTGDRVLVTGAQAITGTPASDLNGPHIITVSGPSDFTIPLSASNVTGGGGLNYAATYRLATGASGTAIGAGTTGDAFVGYSAGTGEFAFGDFIAGDTSSAYFTDDSQGGSQPVGHWTVVGWTNETSISAAYLSSTTVGQDETVYVRVRGVGLLRGDWATATATSLGTQATAAVTYDVTTGAIVAGGNAAQIQYSLAGWFTHEDDTDPSLTGTTTTTKTVGTLPANHIVKSIEYRVAEIFDSDGADLVAAGHSAGGTSAEYGFVSCSALTSVVVSSGLEINALSTTELSADMSYIRTGSPPTTGKVLVIFSYIVVPPEPTA